MTRLLRGQVWTLGHLRYPLAWVLEAARVETDGPNGEGARNWDLFHNTASLVDVYDAATKILFVLPTDIFNGITFGEMDYVVGVAGERGQIRDRAPVYDADPLIAWMVDTVCRSRTSLKEVMNDYTEGRILNGLDWTVIDGMVGLLTARYPPRPEETRGMVGNDENIMNGWWAPAQVFAAYNGGVAPAPGYVVGDSSFYCHGNAVSALDHTLLPRVRSRKFPAAQFGVWTNAGELIVMMGIGNYEAQPVGDLEISRQRLYCTGADRIERTAFIRRAMEEWKVSGGNLAEKKI